MVSEASKYKLRVLILPPGWNASSKVSAMTVAVVVVGSSHLYMHIWVERAKVVL